MYERIITKIGWKREEKQWREKGWVQAYNFIEKNFLITTNENSIRKVGVHVLIKVRHWVHIFPRTRFTLFNLINQN